MRVPSSERSRWTGAASSTIRLQLATSVAAWYGAAGLSRDAFRARFLDPSISDQTVDDLRSATKAIVEGGSYADLAKAGKDLAAAAQGIGVSRWSRFVSGSSQKALAAVSRGEVPGVIKVGADGATMPSSAVALGTLIIFSPKAPASSQGQAPAQPPQSAGFKVTTIYPETQLAALGPYTGPPLSPEAEEVSGRLAALAQQLANNFWLNHPGLLNPTPRLVGSLLHTDFENAVKAMNDLRLVPEFSRSFGFKVTRGLLGSVRTDVELLDPLGKKVLMVINYKTTADPDITPGDMVSLTPKRVNDIRKALTERDQPIDYTIPVVGIMVHVPPVIIPPVE